MKYKDLLSFEPITEVVKFDKTNKNTDYQKSLVKTFVFSEAFKENLIPLIVRNLDFNQSGESFGLQIVGNYGTGKSHLMSLISLIAEKESLIELVKEDKPKEDLSAIAGKFKVLRFELGGTESLWDFVTYKVENFFEELGIEFSFDNHGPITYAEKLQLMMAEFENKFPDKGFMLVIDEMLSYLKGRGASDKLNQDLQALQALGQACDSTKFKFIYGVQELIYHSQEFQFAAEMLQKVNDRYKDIIITKDDVAFIVKNRLLSKTEHQKQAISKHLDPFLEYFTDMHARTQDYVELYPVHPSYFENFQKIKIGKSQREILKTLSNQFMDLMEKDVPTDNPGLLTYDMYWEDMKKSQDLMANPDVRTVKGVTDTIDDKIDTFFTGAREGKKAIAKRITNACAIKLLQHDLNKQNGTVTELLVDDLCLTDKMAFDRDFLIDTIESTSKNIIKATSGQYFDENKDNSEFHIRIEGGINFDQNIKVYADQMNESVKDEYFFKFLEVNLPLSHETYRSGFKIWEHTLEWKSHKTFRDGYIFFGNPNEKSTTQPLQHFYMYFMPIFEVDKQGRNNDNDEIYFVMNGLSSDFKEAVSLYGAALALEARADSSKKAIYRQKINELNKKARAIFDTEYTQATKVYYKGNETLLSGYSLPGEGSTKEQIFSDVASLVLDDWFVEERKDYPVFSQLNNPIAKDNFQKLVKQALNKVANPEQANRDGEGVLSGLGLWVPGRLDYSHSPYAKSIVQLLKDKGEGMVLNRDEIIDCIHAQTNLWLTKDFGIEAELEFIVLATLSALGEIEISLSSGKTINSTNLNELKTLIDTDYFSFVSIKKPRGLNYAALKEVFIGLLGKDLSTQLKNPSTYTELVTKATEWANRAVTINSKISTGFIFKGIEVISISDATELHRDILAFSRFCDKLGNYNSEARIKNFQFTTDEVKSLLQAKPLVEKIENQLAEIKDFEDNISYLQQAKQYITDDNLKQDISNAINKLAEVLSSDNKSITTNYKKDLEKLKNKYAKWYLEQYLNYRISQNDDTTKQAILNSDTVAVCNILKDADFLPVAKYSQLIEQLYKLKVVDDNVNKQTILSAPYQDFNPIDFINKPIDKISEIKEQLEELLDNWTVALKEILDDPMATKNLSLFGASAKKLINDFKSGKIIIDKSNALNIRKAIEDLQKGLTKVELDTDSLKSVFNKPLSPDDAITAFKQYIDKVSAGKERDKIRIILK